MWARYARARRRKTQRGRSRGGKRKAVRHETRPRLSSWPAFVLLSSLPSLMPPTPALCQPHDNEGGTNTAVGQPTTTRAVQRQGPIPHDDEGGRPFHNNVG